MLCIARTMPSQDVRPFVGLSGGLSDCQCQTPAFCQKRLHISSNFFHCWVLVFLYHTAWQYSTAASNARRYEKNHDFRSISRFISEMMQDRVIVTMEGESETAPKLSNDTSLNDLEWPPTQISRSRHYLTMNMSETVRDTDIVTMTYSINTDLRRCHDYSSNNVCLT